jgi:hypothetical protein
MYKIKLVLNSSSKYKLLLQLCYLYGMVIRLLIMSQSVARDAEKKKKNNQ